MKIPTSSRWVLPFSIAAWAAFVVSFFLPSFADYRGWQCAIAHGSFWSEATRGDWASIHYLLLTLPNLLMLASPWVLLRSGGSVRGLRWFRYSTFTASLLVASFLALVFFDDGGGELRVGAFVWATSFVLLWLSVILPNRKSLEPEVLKYGTMCT